MSRLPAHPDLVLRLLAQGYDGLAADRAARCPDGADGDAYLSRMLGRRTLVLRGEEGVRFFYDDTVAARKHAVPFPLAGLLFGRGALHGLDGEEHLRHKRLFTAVLGPDRYRPVVAAVGSDLERRLATGPADLFDVCVEVYGRAVIAWAGVEVDDAEAVRTSHVLAQIVDGFGFAPTAYPRAWRARNHANRWATRLVGEVRHDRRTPPPGSVLATFAAADDLSDAVAGVELLNVLRPTVAVAWFAGYLAVALDRDPRWRGRLRTTEVGADHVAFAHEVRRTAPFAPALTARVRRAARHGGIEVDQHDRLVLDLWGTDHVASRYPDAGRFRPERWLERPPGAHDFVPHGGGTLEGHRCPGESLTVGLLAETARVLAGLDLQVLVEDEPRRHRMPTRPAVEVRPRRPRAPA